MNRNFRFLVTILSIFTASFAFIGGDCTTDSENPPIAGGVGAPANLTLTIDANPGGSSFAIISWDASANESDDNFRGYRISTYQLDSTNAVDTLLSSDQVSKTTRIHTVSDVQRNVRYRTYVVAELNDGSRSDSVATPVYGGIFYNNNGSIDEYMASGPAESGYGWDVFTGAGTQYAYTAGNAANIDIHLRDDNGQLTFYSPNIQSPGTKTTLFRLIGTGDDAFDQTELEEPDQTSIAVNDDEVYLIRTDEGNYIKIWISQISDVGSPAYSNVRFEYKVQPIQGLRVLKHNP